MQVAEIQLSVNPEDALTAKTINSLISKKEATQKEILICLCGLLENAIGFFNLSKNMHEGQVIETAQLLLEEFRYETIEDFVLMLKQAKKGQFGEVYNRIDGQIIFGWMKRYLESKAELREKKHLEVKNNGLKEDAETKLFLECQPTGLQFDPEETERLLNELKGTDKEKSYSDFKVRYLTAKIKKDEKTA